MNCIEKSNSLLTPKPRSHPSLFSDVIRVKMFVLKHWIFLEGISNFNKCKSLTIDRKCWMLQNARETIILLSKGNDNFATTVISTENIEKIVEEVRRKNQTYFFSKLLDE